VLGREQQSLEHIVAVTARIKSSVVEEDEKDTGLRNILNYGHTIGHGVESASSFSLGHGESVAIGMVAAGWIAASMGILAVSEVERLKDLLVLAGLPVTVPDHLNAKDITDAMSRDKKILKGRLRFVLLSRIGEAVVRNDVSTELVNETLLRSYAAA
jgi:3-dehydroquinate synthase